MSKSHVSGGFWLGGFSSVAAFRAELPNEITDMALEHRGEHWPVRWLIESTGFSGGWRWVHECMHGSPLEVGARMHAWQPVGGGCTKACMAARWRWVHACMHGSPLEVGARMHAWQSVEDTGVPSWYHKIPVERFSSDYEPATGASSPAMPQSAEWELHFCSGNVPGES